MSIADLAAWRAYFWPGTEVLRNKLDLRDGVQLAEAEALLTRARMEQGVPITPITPAGFCAIHRHVFQDLYHWAGKYRKANMRRPDNGAFFCKVEFIAQNMELACERLRALTSDDDSSAQAFAAAIVAPLADLNAIHPFREGNGRVLRIFITQLSERHGMTFDQTKIDASRWNAASRDSFMTGNTETLQEVLSDGLSAEIGS